jgi:hypothetical protein
MTPATTMPPVAFPFAALSRLITLRALANLRTFSRLLG